MTARGRVVVIGLGPAGPDLLPAAAADAIERVPVRFVRTTRHPAAVAVPGAVSFDDLYEHAERFDDVYRAIVDALVAAAGEHGEVLYAVPGSPRVLERSVDWLLDDGRVEVEVVPAVSFLDIAWARLGVDPFEQGVRLVDAHRFAERAAGERGPLLVAHCHANWVLSDVKLAFEDDGPPRAVILQRLGLPDENVVEVGWSELDRAVEADHLTSVWIPEVTAPVAAELTTFWETVRALRERCPWDREQTHRSLTRYLIEEAYEVVEAIEEGDVDHLEEELGDLLLQVFLHSAIATQAGDFTLADVARVIDEKMIRRHPHVFGDVEVASADDVRRNWDEIKRGEKAAAADGLPPSALDGIPGALPALLYALKLGRKAAAAGVDRADASGAFARVQEQLAGVDAGGSDPGQVEEQIGDLLYAVVDLARHLSVDPEAALRGAAARFRERFVED
ncbi:MAG TPA: nucleoside triphosphate pyrophosphohydrolase [Acidimicrobiales bacterium]|nr:nucleoside triphosphate pyrophosphohydrolase [Acidimicrobiales bacterium]